MLYHPLQSKTFDYSLHTQPNDNEQQQYDDGQANEIQNEEDMTEFDLNYEEISQHVSEMLEEEKQLQQEAPLPTSKSVGSIR